MKSKMALVFVFLGGFSQMALASGFSSATGSVTPTELTVTFTSVNLIGTTNSSTQLLSGSYPITFKRTAGDMVAVQFGSTVNVPVGRYIGISLGMDFTYSVKVDGEYYRGTTANTYTDGATKVYTVGTDARATGAIAQNGTAVTASNLTATGTTTGGATSGTTNSYFGKVVCVSTDGSGCQSSDLVVGSSVLPDIYVMMDLYNAVAVDATNTALAINNTYPVPMVGKPGVAIHLQDRTTNTGAEWMAIFGSDKSLLATRGFMSQGSGTAPSGGNYVTATSGTNINAYGPTTIMSFDATNDLLKTPMGDCPTSTCTSKGLLTLKGVTTTAAGSQIGAVSNTSTTTGCTDDSTGWNGYKYTGGTCSGLTVPQYTVMRIVDPGNVFGKCPALDPTQLSGVPGTCVASSASGLPGGYY